MTMNESHFAFQQMVHTPRTSVLTEFQGDSLPNHAREGTGKTSCQNKCHDIATKKQWTTKAQVGNPNRGRNHDVCVNTQKIPGTFGVSGRKTTPTEGWRRNTTARTKQPKPSFTTTVFTKNVCNISIVAAFFFFLCLAVLTSTVLVSVEAPRFCPSSPPTFLV